MKDPMRLIDADGTEFERLLLQTAAREVPSPEVSARMLAGAASAGAAVALLSSLELANGGAATLAQAGVATQVAGTGAVAGAASGSIAPPAAASLLGSWLVKWGVLGALFSGAVVSGFLVVQSGRERANTSAREQLAPESAAVNARVPRDGAQTKPSPARIQQTSVEPSRLPDPPVHSTAARAAGVTAASGSSAGVAPVAPSSLGQELALLDAARQALTAGEAEKTLALISSYRKRFPDGALEQEATVLEVDALEAKGRAAQASDLKEQFLAEHPDSAHRERVKRSGQNQ
jgi:hypothetical protein